MPLLRTLTLLSAFLAPAQAQHPHTFATDGDRFTLDGKPFKVISGELHYARIPREFWHARLKMARAMGLNTVATYVFWNVHEPTPGHFNFSGNADLRAFLLAAQQEGLFVILRAGPYACAEWDLGGLPSWLLKSSPPTPVIPSAARNLSIPSAGSRPPSETPTLNQPPAVAGVPHPSRPYRDPGSPSASLVGWDVSSQSTSDSSPQHPAPLRSTNPSFLTPADLWIHRLGREVADLQVGRGGPILMTQVENEYGNFGSDKAYMQHLKSTFEAAGFTQSLLYSADNWRNIPRGDLPGLLAATNFGIGNHQGGINALARERPGAPLFVSEYWPGWFDHWGHPHETRPIAPQLEDVDYILHRGAGINIYMFHGGTSFGFLAGASWTNNQYLPDVTSYDYDAPLDESGRPTPKFYAYRKLLAPYTCTNPASPATHVPGSAVISTEGGAERPLSSVHATTQASEQSPETCLPPIPPSPPTIAVPQITLAQSTPLWDHLPTPIPSQIPLSMEDLNQAFGYILYRKHLDAPITGDLTLTGLHDFAAIYLDHKLIATLDRRKARLGPDRHPLPLSVPVTTSTPATLDILVANDGRINSTAMMRTETQGLTGPVNLAGNDLSGWQIYLLPMSPAPTAIHRQRGASAPDPTAKAPTFRSATFNLTHTGDTFLAISHLGKGALWINGHPIGRFWNLGPQQTLYVPGPWLRVGSNKIVVFDMLPPTGPPTVSGLDHPILNAQVPDHTSSQQE